GGVLVACADDPGAARLADSARSRGIAVRTYGESETADVRTTDVKLEPLGSAFRIETEGRRSEPVRVRTPGRHHVPNATAGYAAATWLGFPDDRVRAGLSLFGGTGRRFEFKGEAGGVRVFDDYAHHPTEMVVNLQTARRAAGEGRVVVCFRPLRHTRTRVFPREIGEALGLADEVVVMDPT